MTFLCAFGSTRRRRKAIVQLALCLITVALASGCASTGSKTQTARLQNRLRELGPAVDQFEAARLASAAVQKSEALGRQYHVVWPPWIHNSLVNAGWRERGLCFHWANDLMTELYGLGFWTLQIHLAVARMDTRHEHNALVVTARGQPFSEGLVLDAWRHSGRLWFGSVATDKYPWTALPADRVPSELQKFVLDQPLPDAQ